MLKNPGIRKVQKVSADSFLHLVCTLTSSYVSNEQLHCTFKHEIVMELSLDLSVSVTGGQAGPPAQKRRIVGGFKNRAAATI